MALRWDTIEKRELWGLFKQLGRISIIAIIPGLVAASVEAQVSYTVFSAKSSDTQTTVSQPTRRPEDSRVTLVVKDSTIAYVVHALTQQAQLQVLYNNANPIFHKHVDVQIVDLRLPDALVSALKGTGLVAVMASDRETVVIRPKTETQVIGRGHVAEGIITGRVTDSASGMGLGSATVKVQGTSLSAVTSDSGRFTIRDVPVGDQVLAVKLFGYRPAERTITVVDSERTTVRITMVPIPTVLSGVVTTATGQQRRIEVGNDITSINVDSNRVAPITSVTDLLETRVPGLTVLHSSGDPGSPSRLRLRGVGSISGNNDPIIIIDGIRVYSSQSNTRNSNLAPVAQVSGTGSTGGAGASGSQLFGGFGAPSPIDQLDPASIAKIEVFKGPSASALYGSDAANGVIVITTKRGQAGPTRWTLDVGQGINWIPGSWPTNYYRFGKILGDETFCNWQIVGCQLDSVRTFQALNDPRYTVLSRGSDQTASLSVTGGTPTLQYSVTGSAAGSDGNLKLPAIEQERYTTAYGSIPGWMVRPDRLTTWGVNGSLTASPTAGLRVTLQSSLFNSAQQTSTLQAAIQQLQGVYISGGNISYATGIDNQGGLSPYKTYLPLATVPLIDNYQQHVTDNQITTGDNLTLQWQPIVWLPITAAGGIQTIQRTDLAYVPFGVNIIGGDTTGHYGLGRGLSRNQTISAGTEVPLWQRRISLAFGGNFYSEGTNDFTAYSNVLAPGVSAPSNFFTTCSDGSQCGSAGQSSSTNATYGYYVEPLLKINSRFFAAPGFRLDGGSGGSHLTSSSGGSSGGLSAFPKLDFSYVAVDRQGTRPLWGVISLLRPRLAFGLAGTQPPPEYRLRLFNIGGETGPGGEGSLTSSSNCSAGSTTLPLNGISVPVVCLSSLGNTNLHPERSREIEAGADMTLWQGRLTLTYTQYNKTRKDAIISIPVAPSVSQLGGSQFNIAENIGEVRNTGTETTINATLIERRAFSWNIGGNLSNDDNVLVHLNPGQASNYNIGLVPGYPLFGEWIKPIRGFADQNHDGVIEANEVVLGDSLQYAGQPNPKYQLNVTTDVHLFEGRLGVYATFAYQNGLTQNNAAALNSASMVLAGNNPSTPLSYQAAIQASCSLSNGSNCTDYGVIQTVNTFRFDQLSINYELPKAVASRFRSSHMTVSLQGKNLGLHTNYRGKDPTYAFSTVSPVDQTIDLGQIPEPRTWWLKLTLGN